MAEQHNLLEIEGLCQYYPVPRKKLFERKRFVKAVDGLTLSIPRGCTYGLVGESGCGKSTTGQMLAGILPPTAGTIRYDGQDLTRLPRAGQRAIRQKIQVIFQDPYASLNPRHKIGWILEEPLQAVRHLPAARRKALVLQTLEAVGLDASYADKYASELSGGQRQRVSIAAALILDPECIIADEAVSALDVSVQAQILNLLRQLQKERGLTYLFISHDLQVVEYMSDYIGVMYLGHLVETGTAAQICRAPCHPYTQALLSAVPSVHTAHMDRIPLSGEVPSPVHTPAGCPFHTRCPRATDRCAAEMPEMRTVCPGHAVRCHYAEERN